MGWRFSKRVKVLPGVTLNFGKRGVTTSVGVPGAHVTLGNGKIRQTVGIPGTGLSYTDVQSTHAPASGSMVPVREVSATEVATASESGWVTAGRIAWKVLYWLTIGIFVAALALVVAVLTAGSGSSRRRR